MLEVLEGKISAAGIANIPPVLLDLEDPASTPPTVDAIVSSMTLHHVRDIPRLARIFFPMLGPAAPSPWRTFPPSKMGFAIHPL